MKNHNPIDNKVVNVNIELDNKFKEYRNKLLLQNFKNSFLELISCPKILTILTVFLSFPFLENKYNFQLGFWDTIKLTISENSDLLISLAILIPLCYFAMSLISSIEKVCQNFVNEKISKELKKEGIVLDLYSKNILVDFLMLFGKNKTRAYDTVVYIDDEPKRVTVSFTRSKTNINLNLNLTELSYL